MNFNEWEKIFSSISAQSDLDKINVIDRIAEELKKQNEDIHKEWLQSNFDINHTFKVTSTKSEVIIINKLLHIAAWNGHLDIVKYLIDKKNVAPDIKNNAGGTPLHAAAIGGHLKTVKYFVDEKSVDPNMKNNFGATPLHVAAIGGHLEIIKYLIDEKKVDPDVKDNLGTTPLHVAAMDGHLGIVKYLAEELTGKKKVNINAKDSKGNASLHIAASYDHFKIVKYFVDEKSVDPNIKNDCGNTPLHYAASYGHTDTVTALIEKGAKVDAVNEFGCTSLHYTAQDGYTDTVEVLIRSRADVNKMDEKEGFTPLHLAVFNNNLEIVKALLGNKANPLLKNKYGKTSRDLAKNEEVRQLLKEAEDKQRTNKAIKTGSICSVIAALTVAIGCIATNVSMLVIASMSLAAALIVGGTAGVITYAVLKPSNKLNELNIAKQQSQNDTLTVDIA